VPSPKFYVAAPIGDRTGGPEALALLVDSMRKKGVEAYLIPFRNFRGRVQHPEYAKFDSPIVQEMPDHPDAHLVIGEVSPIESRKELGRTVDSHIWMMWLSVNNSPLPAARYYKATEGSCSMFPAGSGSVIPSELWPYDDSEIDSGSWRNWREARRRKGESVTQIVSAAIEAVSIRYAQSLMKREINFGTQSYYGQGFLRSMYNRDSFILTDYPQPASPVNVERERNVVSYNGAKGQWKINDLRRRLPEVDFVPIENMSFDQVRETLARSSIYVEIGNLPGRDRLPREAANLGTPTILLSRGSGYCWADFPLGERYRFAYTEDWADHMAPVIAETLADTSEINATQADFRAWVAGEPERYDQALDAWLQRAHHAN
jgi:hypothetical protein